MSPVQSARQVVRHHGWAVLMGAITIFSIAFAIYVEYFRDRHPHLRYEIVSDASVLDVREKLGNLEIMYNGVDIQKLNQSLRVIVVRVLNDGPGDILMSNYDDRAPLGFQIGGGSLVRAELLTATNSYLAKTVRIVRTGPSTVTFHPVILEASESFTVKTLILHGTETRPSITPFGKVAGVRGISIDQRAVLQIKPNFFISTFSGGPGAQVARLVAYTLGVVILTLAIVVPVSTASDALAKRRRRRHVAQFKSAATGNMTPADEFIFAAYLQRDLEYLRDLHRFVSTEESVHRAATRNLRRARRKHRGLTTLGQDGPIADVIEGQSVVFHQGRRRWFDPTAGMLAGMLRAGVLLQDADRWRVEPRVRETLVEFIRFVEIKTAD